MNQSKSPDDNFRVSALDHQQQDELLCHLKEIFKISVENVIEFDITSSGLLIDAEWDDNPVEGELYEEYQVDEMNTLKSGTGAIADAVQTQLNLIYPGWKVTGGLISCINNDSGSTISVDTHCWHLATGKDSEAMTIEGVLGGGFEILVTDLSAFIEMEEFKFHSPEGDEQFDDWVYDQLRENPNVPHQKAPRGSLVLAKWPAVIRMANEFRKPKRNKYYSFAIEAKKIG